jgi:hypothetical protein
MIRSLTSQAHSIRRMVRAKTATSVMWGRLVDYLHPATAILFGTIQPSFHLDVDVPLASATPTELNCSHGPESD